MDSIMNKEIYPGEGGKNVQLPWRLLNPNSSFKNFWNFILILLLLYTATFMPYQISFLETNGDFWLVFDFTIDGLFLFDVFINLFSSYYKNDGELEISHKKVVTQYAKT